MFNLKPFKIKKVTTTYGGGNTSVSYNVYKRFLFVFWAIARKKDVSTKESISYRHSVVHYSSIEKAKQGIEDWKNKLAFTNKKVKVLDPI